jgi:hypothetical protein
MEVYRPDILGGCGAVSVSMRAWRPQPVPAFGANGGKAFHFADGTTGFVTITPDLG